jgi:hypothetical protein
MPFDTFPENLVKQKRGSNAFAADDSSTCASS